MTGKQALTIAIQAKNEEFNRFKAIKDKSHIAGCFHFIVDGERFSYYTDGLVGEKIKTGVCKIKKFVRGLEAITIR